MSNEVTGLINLVTSGVSCNRSMLKGISKFDIGNTFEK